MDQRLTANLGFSFDCVSHSAPTKRVTVGEAIYDMLSLNAQIEMFNYDRQICRLNGVITNWTERIIFIWKIANDRRWKCSRTIGLVNFQMRACACSNGSPIIEFSPFSHDPRG